MINRQGIIIGSTATTVLWLLLVGTAFAQEELAPPYCHDRRTTLERFEQFLGQHLEITAVADNGVLVDLLVNPDTTAFSLLITDPKSNQACLGMSGDGWRAVTGPGA